MKKTATLFLSVYFLLFLVSIGADGKIPEKFPEKTKDVLCDEDICYKATLGDNNEVFVDIWTNLDASEFENEKDALNKLYFNFDSWKDRYNEKANEKILNYSTCKELPIIIHDGIEIRRQYIHYSTVANSITFEMRDVSRYWPVTPSEVSDILIAYEFTNIHGDNEFYTPDVLGENHKALYYPEGLLKEKSGYLLLKDDKENDRYLFFMRTKMVPNFLRILAPQTIKDHMLKSIVSLAFALLS